MTRSTGSLALAPTRLALCIVWVATAATSAKGQSFEEGDTEVLQATQPSERGADDVDVAKAANLIVQQTNTFRQDKELRETKSNAKLTAAARFFADYMARTDRYGHYADGKRPAQRAKDHGYDYCLVAENIAYAYKSIGYSTEPLAEEFVEGWWDSPRHRENMLNPTVTETGVAVAYSETTGHWYAVQMFGLPESAAIQFQIANESGTAVSYSIGEKGYELPPRYSRQHWRCRPMPIDFDLSRKSETKESESTDSESTESKKIDATVRPKPGDQIQIVEEDGERRVVRSESS